MPIKSFFAKIYANRVAKKTYRWANDPIKTQEKVFLELISQAKDTTFGKDHHFEQIKTHKDFIKQIPIRDYEDLKPYVERVKKGETDVLWPGKPIYFAKTSGTTSGSK